MKKTVVYKNEECAVVKFTYSDGSRGLRLVSTEDGHPVMSCTISLGREFKENEVIIKDYSENKGIYNILLHADVIKAYSRRVQVGHNYGLVCNLNC